MQNKFERISAFILSSLSIMILTPSAHANSFNYDRNNEVFSLLTTYLENTEKQLSESVNIAPLDATATKQYNNQATNQIHNYSLSTDAKKSLSQIKEYAVDRKENMQKYGDIVQSSEIIPEAAQTIEKNSNKSTIRYSVLFRRTLPQLNDSEGWVERIEYDVKLDESKKLIEEITTRDLNYYLEQEKPTNTSSQKQYIQNTAIANVNRAAIVSYAEKYAYTYNPNYVSYAAQHSDCTNFASQAMYAGGWTKNYEWMGNDTTTTAAWAVADSFYWYGLGRGLTTYANMYSVPGSPYQYMRTGDLMFYTYPSSKKMKHTMIIAKIVNGEPYLTYHSNDNRNAPLSSIVTKVEGDTSFLILNVTP